jgi:polyisoprenoid-binding protein YceI
LNFKEKRTATLIAGLLLAACAAAQPHEVVLRCNPAQTKATFRLSATAHTVHGIFLLRRCEVHFDPASKRISGEIVFDATSGNTGNDGRDRKMHKDVLESGRFPDIAFRLDRVEGNVSEQGPSTVQVHGMFSVHGTDHELTVPVEVRFEGNHWFATANFPVPYVEWGMKNPSNLFLHVRDSVDAEFHGAGDVSPGPSN